jgi:hypothetical protein
MRSEGRGTAWPEPESKGSKAFKPLIYNGPEETIVNLKKELHQHNR